MGPREHRWSRQSTLQHSAGGGRQDTHTEGASRLLARMDFRAGRWSGDAQEQAGRGERCKEQRGCRQLGSAGSVSLFPDISLCASSGPRSSHLPNGESHLRSDPHCPGHVAAVEWTAVGAQFPVSSWQKASQFTSVSFTPNPRLTQYRLFNKCFMNK